jgi:hypothetical protein
VKTPYAAPNSVEERPELAQVVQILITADFCFYLAPKVRKNRNKRSFVVFKANKGRSMNITQIVNKNPKVVCNGQPDSVASPKGGRERDEKNCHSGWGPIGIATRIKPFDGRWMQETFDIFWDYAQWVVNWTNSLLIPPSPQILQLMGAASQIPALARRIANGFNNPPDYAPWWFDAGRAHEVIKSFAGASV